MAAAIPRPRINLPLYHGAFAPRGLCHEEPGPIIVADEPDEKRAAYVKPKHFAWAKLLKRVLAIDVLKCPDCSGRLRLLATVTQPAVIDKILTHLGLTGGSGEIFSFVSARLRRGAASEARVNFRYRRLRCTTPANAGYRHSSLSV